jgi:hypothetical protein
MRVYQKVLRLVPQTANQWQYMNECAVLGSRKHHHSACRMASLCEHWELHNTSICHHVCHHICDFSMDVKLEQRANIKFCVKLGKSGAKTFQMIRHAYGNEAMSHARCLEWHARFKRGRTSLKDDEKSGWPSKSSTPKNVETIWRLVHRDCRRTIKDRTAQTILTCDFNMHHVAAKFVPRLLTPRTERAPCCNLSRASSACCGWPILHVEGHRWGRELGLWVWSRD